jgi:hypothetical protein
MSYTNYHIAAKQSRRIINERGGKFYETTLHFIEVGNDATIMLSSEPNGKGKIIVDDVVKVTAKASNGRPLASFEHDFSNNCGDLTPRDPVNLTKSEGFERLHGRTVSIEIEMYDKCGRYISSSDFYICVSEQNVTN